MELRGKRVLLIGSGWDLEGRRLGKAIDEGKWDIVARVNRLYGTPQDVGRKTDIMFTRWRSWIGKVTPRIEAEYVILNDKVGITNAEYDAIREELGCNHVSAGTLACAWLLNRGATVDYIGCGQIKATDSFYPKAYGKKYNEHKSTTDSGGTLQSDRNEHYRWDLENAYLLNNGINLL